MSYDKPNVHAFFLQYTKSEEKAIFIFLKLFSVISNEIVELRRRTLDPHFKAAQSIDFGYSILEASFSNVDCSCAKPGVATN